MRFWQPAIVAFLVVVAAAASVRAAETGGLSEIARRLDPPPVVRTSFTQRRHMEILTRPLLTEGRMIFAENAGLAWLVEAPFRTNLSLTRSHVTEWEEGAARRRVPLSTRPALSTLVAILMPILAADFDGLAQDFFVKETVSEDNWHVVLTPRDAAMAEVISSIEISGDHVVRELVVREVGGDWTELLFDNYLSGAPALSSEERRYFEE